MKFILLPKGAATDSAGSGIWGKDISSKNGFGNDVEAV